MSVFRRLLIGCIVFAISGAAQADDKISIAQFGSERFLLYLPLYVAMEEGIFEKHGLDVDLKFAGNDDQIFAAVISGNVNFGMGDPVFTAISHDKNGPGKVVAMMITSLGTRGVTNNAKIPEIKTPQDLDGLRVSSLPEPSTTYTLLSEIKRNDHLDKMKIVQAAFGGQIALLESGQVDIATDLEPTVSIYEDKGYRPVLDLTPWMQPQAITGIMTTEDFIKQHSEAVQKLVDSLQEAVNLMYADPQSSYRVAKKIYPQLSDKVVHNAVDSLLSRHVYPHSIVVDDKLWQRTLKTRLDSGELKKPQTTDVAVDNDFALKAAKDTRREMTVLRAHDIGRSFRQPDGQSIAILDNISLELQAGEIVALLGASGSGKTTFLRILCGEETPDKGDVRSEIARPGLQFGYLSQHDRLLPWRSALNNVALGPELAGQSKATARELAREALAAVGMEDFADSRPSQLSGGMQQRVLLARTLALKPKLLLLDEAMSSLDVLARRELAALIRQYTLAQQAAVLVVTHSVEEACALADRVLLITRAPARLFKEIRIEGEGDEALSKVMQNLWAALGVAA